MWSASKQIQNPETVSEYKVGVEVKALFKKNHINLLYPNSGLKHWKGRVCDVHQQSAPRAFTKEDRKDIGSLISAVEWKCFDEDHSRGNTHILHNIIEFRVNTYAAQKMHPGGSWFLCLRGYRTQRLSSTLRTKDGRCFLYAVYLGLLDLSMMPQCARAVLQIRK